MPANTFGVLFALTSFGESHGPAIGGVVDGCPPGLMIAEADLQQQLERRRPGRSRFTSQRREKDIVNILSGVCEGKTLGTPIAFIIENTDARSRDYEQLKDSLRPNHADYCYLRKYGLRDHRGSGRASARETAVRVAAGAIARKYLASKGVVIRGCLKVLGDIHLDIADWNCVDENPFFCPDPARLPELENFMKRLLKEGDSIGAQIIVSAKGVPDGLGEPVYGRLDAELASAMMSINAVKAVEVGDGVAAAGQRGSEHRDEMTPEGFLSNHSGGILGGISTGQEILVSVTLKPTSSIRIPANSIDSSGKPIKVATHGRHDPCVGLRAVPVAEAMMALVLMDQLLRHRAQNAEVQAAVPRVPPEID